MQPPTDQLTSARDVTDSRETPAGGLHQRLVSFCDGCGKPGTKKKPIHTYFGGVGNPSVKAHNSECYDIARPKRKKVVSGIPGHNRGKKYIKGHGYVSVNVWLKMKKANAALCSPGVGAGEAHNKL